MMTSSTLWVTVDITAVKPMKNYLITLPLVLLFSFFLTGTCNASEIITKDLGVRNVSFGSLGQSRAMLSLIKDNPHRFKYQINYKTEAGRVVFSCDIPMSTITRVYKQKDGSGTVETWQGDTFFRLQAAAKGGSLNDTQQGKSAGTFSHF